MIISMDALFGLPRKKSAGISFRDAIHGHLFFGQQERVDDYVVLASLRNKKEPKVYSIYDKQKLYYHILYRPVVISLLEIHLDH